MESSPTVLVVDDEPIVREVVVGYLQREGFRTLEAGDGDRAKALLENGRYERESLRIHACGQTARGSEMCSRHQGLDLYKKRPRTLEAAEDRRPGAHGIGV